MKMIYKNFIYEAVAFEQTPAFQSWFANSKVVDYDGDPLEVYHGTTHDFDTFDLRKTYADGFVGGGFYFTANPDDAHVNYAGKGPDAENKIDELKEQIESNDNSEIAEILGISEEEVDNAADEGTLADIIKAHAEKQILGDNPKPNIMPVFLRMVNPYYIGEEFKQYFEYNTNYDEETEEEGEPEGEGARLIEAIENAINELEYVDHQKMIAEVHEALEPYDGGFTSNQFFDTLKGLEGLIDAYSREENVKPGNFFRDIILECGFDGVIMDASRFHNMKEVRGTLHYIAYSPNQVKSVYNKNPSENNNITKEE